MQPFIVNKPKQRLWFITTAVAVMVAYASGCSFERFHVGIDNGKLSPKGVEPAVVPNP